MNPYSISSPPPFPLEKNHLREGGKGLISLPSNTVCHGRDLEGDEAIKIMGALDGDKIAKSIWEKLSAYTRRALIEID